MEAELLGGSWLRTAAVALAASCAVLLSGCSASPEAGSKQLSPEPQAGAGGAVAPAEVANGEPGDCPATPVLDPSQTARLSLRLSTEYAGTPIAIGEVKSDAEGGTYRLTFFAYYVGNFQLLDSAGKAHLASLVDANDAPLPYGLQLINLDDEASGRLRLAAQPGQYGALRFSVGVHQACNQIPLAERIWPMSFETEMNWGWTMLHLRLECFHQSGANNWGLMYHLGFPEEYRLVQLAAPLELTSSPVEHTLALAVDRLLGADTPSVIAPQQQVVDSLPAAGTFVLQ